MTKEEFNSQTERLKSTWPTSFPDEKIKLIWTAVYQNDVKWFTKVVTDILSNNRQAPLPQEFIHAANIHERYELFRFPTKDEIRPSEGSIFSKSDIAEIFSMIRKRLNGQISSEELNQYGQMIQSAVDLKPRCKQCDDGIVFTESEDIHKGPAVSKCSCMLGRRRTENWPQFGGAPLRLEVKSKLKLSARPQDEPNGAA